MYLDLNLLLKLVLVCAMSGKESQLTIVCSVGLNFNEVLFRLMEKGRWMMEEKETKNDQTNQ